jgi:hypothetical protein
VLESTPLSVSFSVDGEPVEASCRYSEARPLGDFFATTLPGLGLRVVSVYLGSGEFDYVPALHKVSDDRLGNDTEEGRLPAPSPAGPEPGSLAQLLYDHLAVLQTTLAEHRGRELSIDLGEKQISELGLAAAEGIPVLGDDTGAHRLA